MSNSSILIRAPSDSEPPDLNGSTFAPKLNSEVMAASSHSRCAVPVVVMARATATLPTSRLAKGPPAIRTSSRCLALCGWVGTLAALPATFTQFSLYPSASPRPVTASDS